MKTTYDLSYLPVPLHLSGRSSTHNLGNLWVSRKLKLWVWSMTYSVSVPPYVCRLHSTWL